MNLQISLTTLLLVVPLALAAAQDNGTASSSAGQSLVPVNQITRFMLADSLPHLADTMAASEQDSVVLRSGEFRQEDRTIITQVPQAQGKQSAWVQMSNYWIEPVTPPPSRGEATAVPVESMSIVEVQGEVALLPRADKVVTTGKAGKAGKADKSSKTAKVKPVEVNEDMTMPDGSTIVTSDSGSAAVLIGGHTSVRIVPNSQVIFDYDPSGDAPRLEVTVLQGAVFCKVGRMASGRVPDVSVRGQAGALASIGSSDFFVQSDPVSLHICLVRGKLLVGDTNAIPLAVGNMDWYPPDVEANNTTGPQIRHWPSASGNVRTLLDAQVLSLALRQADSLNVKIRALLSSTASPLTAADQDYLSQIPRITWYARATASP